MTYLKTFTYTTKPKGRQHIELIIIHIHFINDFRIQIKSDLFYNFLFLFYHYYFFLTNDFRVLNENNSKLYY
jgi:hypothetical protein